MNNRLAIYYIIVSAVATSIMFALVKQLNNFSVYQIIFFRALITIIFTTPLILKQKIPILGNNKSLLVIRGSLGFISMVCFYHSIKYLTLGVSFSIRYTAPIFAAIFAVFILKESIKLKQWILLLISLCGVSIIKIGEININTTGFIYSFISAVLLGLVYVITRKIGKSENTLVIVNYFMCISLIFTPLMSIGKWISPSLLELVLLIGSGFFGFLGILFLTKAFQNAEVKIIAPFKYLEVVFSFFIGFYFFGEANTGLILLGSIFILFGAFWNVFENNNNPNK
jgi:drug/metabolite transporter (DMT)-like permease